MFLFIQFADAAAYVAFIAQLHESVTGSPGDSPLNCARAVRTLRYSQIHSKQ